MLWFAPALFGIGCAFAVWSAVRARDFAAQIIAACLVVAWASANAAWVHDLLALLPVIDLGLGVVAVAVWHRGTSWAELVANAVAVRLALHVLDTLTGHAFLVPYIHALNATFAWMLVVVATSGGGHDSGRLRRRVRDGLRSLAPARRAVG